MSGFIGVVIFFIGCIVGGIVHRVFTRNAGTNQKLSSNLDSVSREFAEYQDHVDEHFKTTAELVQQMTHSYVAVHQHLAQGAQGLSRASLESLSNEASKAQAKLESTAEATNNQDYPNPPRDYLDDIDEKVEKNP